MDTHPFGVEVECYAGFKADERPAAFHQGARRVVVREVVDAWYGPDHAYFKLLGDDGRCYRLRHDLEDDSWEAILQEAPGASLSGRKC